MMQRVLYGTIVWLALCYPSRTDEWIGDWWYSEYTDPITDTTAYLLHAVTRKRVDSEPYLQVQVCRERVYMSVSLSYALDDYGTVQYRLDKGEIAESRWVAGVLREGGGVWRTAGFRADAISSESVEGAKRLTLRIRDRDGDQVTHVFLVNGFSDALKRLPRAPCDWKRIAE